MLGRKSVGAEQIAGCAGTVAGALVGDRVCGQVFGLRHRYRTLPACGEPSGIPDVVRVVMRGDDAVERGALERGGKVMLPQRAGRDVAVAAIDLRPAILAGAKPQIDVVQRKGQRHAQPQHAGRDFASGTGSRAFRPGVM